MHRSLFRGTVALGAALAVVFSFPASAGIMLFQNDTASLKLGGRMQIQYHSVDTDPGGVEEDLFFRRVTPTFDATYGKDWQGRLQVELMTSTGRRITTIKNGYVQYKGLDGVKVSLGNMNFPYSREFLTSAERQQFVERTLTGSRSYGVPYQDLGVHLQGENAGGLITWGLSGARALIKPDDSKILYDSPINGADGMNAGWIAGGRVDVHPFGKLDFAQGDFDRETRATVGAAAYLWNSSDDAPQGSVDIDRVQAAELSAAARYQGISADAEYNRIEADTVDGSHTGGIYRNGHTVLRSYMVKGGYMLIADRLELVAGYQGLDTDNYAKTWTTRIVGANWYFDKHNLKLQTTYYQGEDVKGTVGKGQDELFAQMQVVF